MVSSPFIRLRFATADFPIKIPERSEGITLIKIPEQREEISPIKISEQSERNHPH